MLDNIFNSSVLTLIVATVCAFACVSFQTPSAQETAQKAQAAVSAAQEQTLAQTGGDSVRIVQLPRVVVIAHRQVAVSMADSD
jgi:hypothetical protein